MSSDYFSISCPRNYPEDYGYENGTYLNFCCVCNLYFIGHKRRFICKTCSFTDSKGDSLPNSEMTPESK